MRFPHWRGSTLVALGGVLLLVAAPPAHHSAAATRLQVQAVQDTWQPRWAPQASLDGLGAFEGVEDDRANSHPAGQPHIFVEGDNYRFNMHMVDRDISPDRQRQEVKGMRTGGTDLILLKGRSWRFTQSMFIPGSLQATTTFTHIMQMKMPGTDSLPIFTVSLQRVDGAPMIELHDFNDNLIVGGQSGSDRVLKSSRRGHDVQAIVRAVRISKEEGFVPNVDFILGAPRPMIWGRTMKNVVGGGGASWAAPGVDPPTNHAVLPSMATAACVILYGASANCVQMLVTGSYASIRAVAWNCPL